MSFEIENVSFNAWFPPTEYEKNIKKQNVRAKKAPFRLHSFVSFGRSTRTSPTFQNVDRPTPMRVIAILISMNSDLNQSVACPRTLVSFITSYREYTLHVFCIAVYFIVLDFIIHALARCSIVNMKSMLFYRCLTCFRSKIVAFPCTRGNSNRHRLPSVTHLLSSDTKGKGTWQTCVHARENPAELAAYTLHVDWEQRRSWHTRQTSPCHRIPSVYQPHTMRSSRTKARRTKAV